MEPGPEGPRRAPPCPPDARQKRSSRPGETALGAQPSDVDSLLGLARAQRLSGEVEGAAGRPEGLRVRVPSASILDEAGASGLAQKSWAGAAALREGPHSRSGPRGVANPRLLRRRKLVASLASQAEAPSAIVSPLKRSTGPGVPRGGCLSGRRPPLISEHLEKAREEKRGRAPDEVPFHVVDGGRDRSPRSHEMPRSSTSVGPSRTRIGISITESHLSRVLPDLERVRDRSDERSGSESRSRCRPRGAARASGSPSAGRRSPLRSRGSPCPGRSVVESLRPGREETCSLVLLRRLASLREQGPELAFPHVERDLDGRGPSRSAFLRRCAHDIGDDSFPAGGGSDLEDPGRGGRKLRPRAPASRSSFLSRPCFSPFFTAICSTPRRSRRGSRRGRAPRCPSRNRCGGP